MYYYKTIKIEEFKVKPINSEEVSNALDDLLNS
jgi:hypothetical protein